MGFANFGRGTPCPQWVAVTELDPWTHPNCHSSYFAKIAPWPVPARFQEFLEVKCRMHIKYTLIVSFIHDRGVFLLLSMLQQKLELGFYKYLI